MPKTLLKLSSAPGRPIRNSGTRRSRLKGVNSLKRLVAGAGFLAVFGVATRAAAERSELPPEVGYNYGEIEVPRYVALGGALRATGQSTDALFTNPANMAAVRIYHLAAIAQIWPEASRQSYGAAAVDSIVSRSHIAGGIGGTWTRQDPDGVDRQATDLRFALAYPFSQALRLGLGGRVLWLEEDGDGPLGDSLAAGGLKDENIVKEIGFDAGVTVQPSKEVYFGLVGNNLNNPGHGFMPTSVGGGAGYAADQFSLEIDGVADFDTWGSTKSRFMAGFEFLAGNNYPLRVGYRYDDGALSHGVSAGLGYIDKQFSAELGVRRIVSGDAATTIVFGFKYHLESTGIGSGPVDDSGF